jgi:CrcB protein
VAGGRRGGLILAVAVGGALGALARALLARLAEPGALPWPTLVANLAGTALLAVGATRLGERLAPRPRGRAFLTTGACGALTTFATMQVEVIRLWRDGRPAVAAGYTLLSIGLGLVVVWLASGLVRRARVLG